MLDVGRYKMGKHGTQLRKVEEEYEHALKYNVHYSFHAAAAAGDTEACVHLSKQKHVNSYNEEGKLAIHCATEGGHLETVDLLLKQGADINAQNKFTGDTCLHIACSSGSALIADILLKKGANVLETNKKGAYAMHIAAEGGHKEIIQLLAAAGGLVNCQDKVFDDPLHYAARTDKADVIGVLHKLGGHLEVVNKLGETALHIAARYGSISCIKKLYQLGANLDCRDCAGETPLHIATRVGRLESIEALAKVGADLYAKNDDKECPLHMASRIGKWKSARHLITAGTDLNFPFKKGSQAIHIAAYHGNLDVIRVLKMEHADLNAEDKSGNRPLHYAVKAEQTEAIKLLVESGADINAPGKRKDTAIHMATKKRKHRLVQLLGSLKADCNKENESALVSLYYAALNEDTLTAKDLIRSGAKLNFINSEGQGLVHIMVEEEQLEGLSTMQALKANFGLLDIAGRTCIHIASKEGQTRVLKHLQDIGVDLSTRNQYGLTALHVAVMEGRGDEVDMLYNIGVDLNCKSRNFDRMEDDPSLCRAFWPPKDIDIHDYWKIKSILSQKITLIALPMFKRLRIRSQLGMTPIHLAFCYQQEDILSHLVTCGADLNQGNDYGETVFHLAVLFSLCDWLPKLLEYGADRNCKDKFGRTPLHYAAHSGDINCLRLLLKFGALATEKDNDGKQASHYAAEAGHFLLLPEITGRSASVDINSTDNNGCTALHYACKTGKMDTIIELLQLNADVYAKDGSGNSVVHQAAASGQHEVIVQLASMGCNLDIQNMDMKTPLHLAGENGQGEAMEVLLMCGCDPDIRDKNGSLASTFKLSRRWKQDVAKRMKQLKESRSSNHTSGEMCYDSWMISVGKPIELRRLNVTVQLDCSSSDVKPIVFLHRTPSDSALMDIKLNGFEEILSDIYELRMLCFESDGILKIEIPLDGYPGNFETFLKTTENEEFTEYTTSEDNGNPVFVGKIPVCRGFKKKFAVLARPRIYEHTISRDGGTLMSELNRKTRIEVFQETFDEPASIKLQVLETSNIDRATERLFAGDIVNIMSTKSPRAKINLQIPLHDASQCDDGIVVFVVNNETDLEDERRWRELEAPVRVLNDCITFDANTFSIYIPVVLSRRSILTTDAAKRIAKEKIKSAMHRESSVLFFYAFCPKKDCFLTIFECTTPGRFQRRSEFWENEGFLFHPQVKHSGHFPARPNHTFCFDVTGNMEFLGYNTNKLKLTFNPRAYKFQSFYLMRKDRNSPQIGELQVFSIKEDIEAKTGGREVLLTSLPIDIPLNSSCVIA